MANVRIQGNALGTGTLTIAAPNTNTDRTLTLPDSNGSMVLADSSGNVAIGTNVLSQPSNTADVVISKEAVNSGSRFVAKGGPSGFTSYVALNSGSHNGTSAHYTPSIMFTGGLRFFSAPVDQEPNDQNLTQTMTLDSGGRLTIPAQPYICRRVAEGASPGNIAANQLIPWDTEIGSSGITYNTSTRRFTVPIAGRYKITGSFFKSGNSGSSSARVLLGVNTDSPSTSSNYGQTYSGIDTTYMSMSFDVILPLSANDFFTFRLTDGPLYSQAVDQFNFMSAHMIG